MKLNTFFLFVLFLFFFVCFVFVSSEGFTELNQLCLLRDTSVQELWLLQSCACRCLHRRTMSSPSCQLIFLRAKEATSPCGPKGLVLMGNSSQFFLLIFGAFDATSRASCPGLAVPKGLMKESSIYSLWFDAQMKNLTHNNRSWSLINHVLVFPHFQKQIPSSVF